MRRYARFPVSVSAQVTDTEMRRRITSRTTDLGIGGCYIDTLCPFAEDTQVEVVLRGEGRIFHCRALVSYSPNGRTAGMGLVFSEIAPDQNARLLDWVKELSQESALGPRDKDKARAGAKQRGRSNRA
jgi:hypothetical protein